MHDTQRHATTLEGMSFLANHMCKADDWLMQFFYLSHAFPGSALYGMDRRAPTLEGASFLAHMCNAKLYNLSKAVQLYHGLFTCWSSKMMQWDHGIHTSLKLMLEIRTTRSELTYKPQNVSWNCCDEIKTCTQAWKWCLESIHWDRHFNTCLKCMSDFDTLRSSLQ